MIEFIETYQSQVCGLLNRIKLRPIEETHIMHYYLILFMASSQSNIRKCLTLGWNDIESLNLNEESLSVLAEYEYIKNKLITKTSRSPIIFSKNFTVRSRTYVHVYLSKLEGRKISTKDISNLKNPSKYLILKNVNVDVSRFSVSEDLQRHAQKIFKKHEDGYQNSSMRQRARQYDIPEDRVKELLSKPTCEICNEPFEEKHIDHCHKTGKVRGILCRQCNHGLGNFKDNKNFLLNAIVYLKLSERTYE